MLDPELKEKVVLVTGANNPYGIGAAVARAFAAQGAKVFLHYFRQHNSSSTQTPGALNAPGMSFYKLQQTISADEVIESVRKFGVQAAEWEADLADAAAIPELFDQAEAALGPVQVVVNNAAYWEPDTFLVKGSELSNKLVELYSDHPPNLAASTFDRIFAVDTRAPALIMAEFARRHIGRLASWGRIINVSTAGAERFPSEVSYGASKFALESYSRSAATELGKLGVTVNVVSLGPVQTGWISPELERALLPTIPLNRIGSPEDVADVIIFLASHQARWVTGQRIYVGGGHGM